MSKIESHGFLGNEPFNINTLINETTIEYEATTCYQFEILLFS